MTLSVLSTPKGVIMRRMRTGRDAALIPAPKDDLCLAFAIDPDGYRVEAFCRATAS